MNKEEKLNILKDLIELNTINNDEKLVAEYLADVFIKHGIDPSQIKKVGQSDNRTSLVVDINPTNTPVLAFTGHEDVVSSGDLAAWQQTAGQAFKAIEKDGRLFGRGTSDMKSGLAAQAIALIELNDDPNFKEHVRFLATVGEEIGMLGATQLADEGFVDDVEALVVGEPSTTNNIAMITQLAASGIMPIAQPNPKEFGRHAIYSAHKGSLNYTVLAKGKTAHSSMPELGINAIDQLLKYYNAQQAYFTTLKEYSNDILGRIVPVNTMIAGGEQPNTVPGSAILTAKIRTIPEYSNEQIASDLQAIIDDLNAKGANLTLQITGSIIPVYTSVDSPLANLARKLHHETWGEDSLVVGATGGTDAAKFVERNPKLEVIIMGPGNETAHQVDEFVLIDDYLQYIDIYRNFAIEYFN